MSNLSDVQDRVRAWLKDQVEARRDLERRRVQGYTAGYKSSGDPRPVPMYPGRPPPDTIKSGGASNTLPGTGGTITVPILAPSNKCSWLWFCVYEVVAGVVLDCEKRYVAYAFDQQSPDGPFIVAHRDLTAFGYRHSDEYQGRLPLSGLEVTFALTEVARPYGLDGVWIEDR